jgi:hypothetical protein
MQPLEPDTVQRLGRLAAWNLRPAVERVRRECGWSEDYAAAVTCEYVRFLALSVIEPEFVYGMAGDVDLLWHSHLEDEGDYARMCEHVIGHLLRHKAGLVFADVERATTFYAENTFPRLGHYFGPPSSIWPDPGVPGFLAKCCSGHIASSLDA